MECRFRTLERWPRTKTPPSQQRPAPFRAGYANTLTLLEMELKHLNARNIVIEADFKQREIRNDGWPRSSARPATPGIILSFDSTFGPMALPCDRFSAWKDNLRAIAFHLHYLRKSDLYGVAQAGEQYRGWNALPPTSPPPFDTAEGATELIFNHAGNHYTFDSILVC